MKRSRGRTAHTLDQSPFDYASSVRRRPRVPTTRVCALAPPANRVGACRSARAILLLNLHACALCHSTWTSRPPPFKDRAARSHSAGLANQVKISAEDRWSPEASNTKCGEPQFLWTAERVVRALHIGLKSQILHWPSR